MKFSQLRGQQLSSVTTMSYLACAKCGVVDTENERMRKGFVCPICGTASRGGCNYFPMAATFVVNMMQSTFHAGQKSPHFLRNKDGQENREVADYQLAVIIYFSTVTDLLIEKLLEELGRVKNTPYDVIRFLLDEHRFTRSRLERIFPLFADRKWKVALSDACAVSDSDFNSIDAFVRSVEDRRNTLLHEGYKWSIPKEMPRDCIDRLPELLSLFVALHNLLVHPRYLSSDENYFEYPEDA